MGGFGSGRYRVAKHTLVEQCAGISVRDIDPAYRGWPLTVTVEGHTFPVRTISTRSVFGKGQQWWFLCPRCQRRCGWLYRPPGAQAYACRRCWGLAYYSQRTSCGRWLRRHWQALRSSVASAP